MFKKIMSSLIAISLFCFTLFGCTVAQSSSKSIDELQYNKIEGVIPTCTTAGYKSFYYSSELNKYFEDDKGNVVIDNIDAWKGVNGLGYLPIDPNAHQMIEEQMIQPTFEEEGHIKGYSCTLCKKHFDSISGGHQISDEQWKISRLAATEITKGYLMLKYGSKLADLSELDVDDVDLSTYTLVDANKNPLDWSKLTYGSQFNAYFVKEGSQSYKAHALVYIEYNHLANGMKDFLELGNEKTANYLYEFGQNGNVTNPNGVTFRWNNPSKENQKIVISTNIDYSNPIYTNTLSKTITKFTLYNELLPLNRYFVKIETDSGEINYTNIFKLYGSLRTITVEGVDNMRDIGGLMTESGKRIPYGLLYRSGKFDDITKNGVSAINKLNINTEIELRLDGASTSYVPGINYVKAGLYHWGHCFPNAIPETKSDAVSLAGMKLAIETLANPSNYPVDIHCSGGADRTGTVIFVIEGLLGVGFEDIAREFELTTFSSYGARYRSSLRYVSNKYVYDDDATMKDKSGFVPSLRRVYKHIMTNYVGEGENFSDGIEKYLLNDIGVAQKDIDSIKNIFLG